jgi:hypothetical protein
MSSPALAYSGDQFGFYTVGLNFKTYSKLLAIEEMQRTGQHLEWHFNEHVFKSYNWKTEPTETLQELYRQRAQRIRDSYDYVVLWYSGGADSRCMLDAFISNDIKIDEIANFVSYEADRDRHSVLNEEIFYNALPHIDQILERYPDIKHRVVDISPIISDIYLRPDVKFEYIYNIKGIMSANSLARSYIREYVNEYKDIIDSGKRMCFLWGAEKPRLLKIDGAWNTCFIDVFSETNLRLQSMDKLGYFDEWFFWAPDAAPIVAKQSHTLMKAMRAADVVPEMLSNQSGAHLPRADNGRYLKNDIYHSLIYPGWQSDLVVAPKPQNLLLSERDNWFWSQNPDTNLAVKNAASGIKEMIRRVGDYWLNDTNDYTRGIKGCRVCYPLE